MHKYVASPTACGTVQGLPECPTTRRSPLITARRPAVRRGPGFVRHDREHDAEESICSTWRSHRLTRLIMPYLAAASLIMYHAAPGTIPRRDKARSGQHPRSHSCSAARRSPKAAREWLLAERDVRLGGCGPMTVRSLTVQIWVGIQRPVTPIPVPLIAQRDGAGGPGRAARRRPARSAGGQSGRTSSA